MMPLHPILVHLPLALAVLMPLGAGALLLAWWRNWLPRRAWVFVILAQATLVLSGFLAMRSGDEDEERVEQVVAERVIEHHEDAAETFVWAAAVMLAFCFVPLLLRGASAARFAALGVVLGTLAVLGLGLQTGHSGGELVYRHGAATAFVGTATAPGNAAPAERRRHGDDDDDDH